MRKITEEAKEKASKKQPRPKKAEGLKPSDHPSGMKMPETKPSDVTPMGNHLIQFKKPDSA